MAAYGRSELVRDFRKNFVLGLLMSIMIHGLAIAPWLATCGVVGEKVSPTLVSVRILKYSDLGPPPSLTARPAAPAVGIATEAKPNFGTPVPVPDIEVSPEQTIATQEELSNVPAPLEENPGESVSVSGFAEGAVSQADTVDRDPGIDEVVPVDKSPEIVSMVIPKYPEMAMRAGIEGTLLVKFLVGKDGHVERVVIVNSTADVFNEVTVEAARKFLFTPAYTQAGTVKVWFEIPFYFRLKDSPLAEHRR